VTLEGPETCVSELVRCQTQKCEQLHFLAFFYILHYYSKYAIFETRSMFKGFINQNACCVIPTFQLYIVQYLTAKSESEVVS
jgi:hypothetical protein